jgi:hypothetical protein
MFPRYNRLVDSSPKCDIYRSDEFGWPSEAAGLTSEVVSRWSVGLRDLAARGADPGGLSRIDEDYRDSRFKCFVLDELPELVETPGMQAATRSFSNRFTGPDALKIFNSDRYTGVFGFRNYILGDAVIDISGKPGYSTGKLLEISLGRLCVFPLKSGFEIIELVSGLIDLFARMFLAIRINRKILDSQIDSKRAFWIVGGLLEYLDYRSKVEDTFDKYEFNLTPDTIHPGFLVIPDLSRDKLSALESRKRNGFLSFPGEDALVIDNCTVRPKFCFDRPVSLIYFNNLEDGPDGKLDRETKPLSNVVVDCFMGFYLVGLADRERYSCEIVARFVKAVHRLQEHLILLVARIEFDHQGFKHHIEKIVKLICSFRYNGWGTLLTGLKTGVSTVPIPQVIL